MPNFTNILVCVDLCSDERRLVSRAAEQAARQGVGLTLLHVIEEQPLRAYRALQPDELSRVCSAIRHYDIGRLEALSATHMDEVAIDHVVRSGDPTTQILEQVHAGGHDLVMCGADSGARLGEQLFGGTTTRLMRQCHVPVWVVKSDQRGGYGKVLAAVDLQSEDGDTSALDGRIVSLAGAIADREGAELHVVHVCPSWVPFANIDVEMEQMQKRIVTAAHRQLDRLLSVTGRVGATLHRIEGNPGRMIPEIVWREQIDMVVMGTVARTGLTGLVFGNTAERVLSRVACSLLAVKPDGFLCPIRERSKESAEMSTVCQADAADAPKTSSEHISVSER